MTWRIAMLLTLFTVVLLSPSVALADKPLRVPDPIASVTIAAGDACAFPIQIDVLTDKRKALVFLDEGTFPPTKVIATGAAKVRLTNLATGASINVNVSGAGHVTFDANGRPTHRLTGRNVLYFASEADTNSPIALLVAGKTILVIARSDIVSHQGLNQDLCALLAG